jgi:hypothetical protein
MHIMALAACAGLLASCATSDDYPWSFDSFTDTGFDTGADAWDTSTDTALDTLVDTAADTSFDPYTDVPLDTWADSLADVPYDTGFDTVYDTAYDSGPDTVYDTGFDTVYDTGFDTGFDTGYDTMPDTAIDTAVDTMPDTAIDTAVDTITDPSGHYTWTEYFDGVSNTAQCTSWVAYRAGLAASGYTGMNLSGTYDMVGRTCTDPVVVQQYADALRTSTGVHLTCDGHIWSLCNRGSHMEMWIDAPTMCDLANCPDPGYLVRPCFSTTNVWCGVNSDTCIGPAITVTVDFW